MDNPAETSPGIPDVRHLSLTRLAEQTPVVTAALRRILPDRTAAALPVCAFQSSI